MYQEIKKRSNLLDSTFFLVILKDLGSILVIDETQA